MSTLELQAELAKKIFNIESEDVLKEISYTIRRLTNKTAKLPGIPAEKELNERTDYFLSAYEEFKNGNTNKFTSQEELEKRHQQIL